MQRRDKEYECIACNKRFVNSKRIDLHIRTDIHRQQVRDRFPECTIDRIGSDGIPWWGIDVWKKCAYLRYRGEPYGDWPSEVEKVRRHEEEKKRRKEERRMLKYL